MTQPDRILCDAARLTAHITSLADQIASAHHSDIPLRLIGVRSRGVPIAERIAHELTTRLGIAIPVGAVDITLYRDDLTGSGRWPVLRGTDVPFDVEDAEIVLVDDVLYTGRTIRAAMNAVCDLGRPASVKLAVLVDRGGRELPIHPDYVGMRVEVSPTAIVRVHVAPHDIDEGIFQIERPKQARK